MELVLESRNKCVGFVLCSTILSGEHKHFNAKRTQAVTALFLFCASCASRKGFDDAEPINLL